MLLHKAIEGFYISKIAEGYSPSTMKSYLSSLHLLEGYLGNPQIETITINDLRKFFFYLRTDYKPNRPNKDTSELSAISLYGKWKAVRTLFNWASQELGIEPIANKLPAPRYSLREVSPFTESEVKLLLSGCEFTAPATVGNRLGYKQHRPTSLRDRLIILILLDSGLRVGELERLRVKDVNLETGEMNIAPFGAGRKSKGRIVYIGKSARSLLWKYLADREEPNPNDSLFLNDEGNPLDKDSVKNMIKRLGNRVGIKSCHAHKFRHTFAIQFLRNGGNVFELQRLLGHSTLDMVRVYVQIAEVDTRTAHRKASPVDNWRLK